MKAERKKSFISTKFTLIELLVACKPTCPSKLQRSGELPVRGRRPIQSVFTLIELLVVIAIIAILASMLLPALKNARDRSHQILCAGNIKQLGMAFQMYINDYDGYFPPYFYGSIVWSDWKKTWQQQIASYIGMNLGDGQTGWFTFPENSVFKCPSQIYTGLNGCYGTSYGYNSVALGEYSTLSKYGYTRDFATKVSQITQPSKQLVNVETWKGSNDTDRERGYWTCDDQARLCFRHFRKANVVYVDGHVKSEDQEWLWLSHPLGYPWNMMMTNKNYFLYSGRGPWGSEYGYQPYN